MYRPPHEKPPLYKPPVYKVPDTFPDSVRKIRQRLRARMTEAELALNSDHFQAVAAVLEAQDGPIYLYGFDNFINLGDQALWLSLDRLIRHLPPRIRVRGLLSGPPFSRAARHRKAAVVFPGGGSMGNRYRSSLRRVELIEALQPHTIVQMPLSTTFDEQESLMRIDRVARAYAAPPESCVFIRDARSRAEAADRLGIEARLVRDLSAFLPDMPDLRVGGQGLLLLLRKDQEATGDARPAPEAGVVADWQDMDAPQTLEFRAVQFLLRQILNRLPHALRNSDPVARLRLWAAGRLSEIQTARAIAFLAGFDRIVTDRLHGVLLARKLGLTGSMLDNDHGKLSRYFETWGTDGIALCPDLKTAIRQASESRAA